MDWRNVASRMGVKPSIIQKFEKELEDPTKDIDPSKRLFQEISAQKITKLLQVLYQMDRHDVLNVFHEDICKQSGKEEPNLIFCNVVLLLAVAMYGYSSITFDSAMN